MFTDFPASIIDKTARSSYDLLVLVHVVATSRNLIEFGVSPRKSVHDALESHFVFSALHKISRIQGPCLQLRRCRDKNDDEQNV